MKINEILLVAAALFPAIVLCVYVYKMDRVEKEPALLLFHLFLAGALCCFPAAYIERFIIDIIDSLFSDYRFLGEDGRIFMTEKSFYIYLFIKYFIGVAVVEEGVKLISVCYITKNNEDFNCLFDGIIYSVFVSLGFAALENVFYVLENGWENAFMRAVLSVPGHMFFAVMMGYHYSLWHITDEAKQIEENLKKNGIISSNAIPFTSSKRKVLGFVLPVLAHTVYNFCCSIGEWWAILGLYCFVAFMYVRCFGKIKDMSRVDNYDTSYAELMIIEKYPYLEEMVSKTEVSALEI